MGPLWSPSPGRTTVDIDGNCRRAGKKWLLLTNMNQPLGRFAGNALEIFECLGNHEGPKLGWVFGLYDLYRRYPWAQLLCCPAQMMNFLSQNQVWILKDILESGKALQMFYQLMEIHGAKFKPNPKTSSSCFSKSNWVYIHSVCSNPRENWNPLHWKGRPDPAQTYWTYMLDWVSCESGRLVEKQPLFFDSSWSKSRIISCCQPTTADQCSRLTVKR